jgi:predicted dehydrogenase
VISQADGSEIDIDIGWLLPELPPCSIAIDGPGGRVSFHPTTGACRWDVHGHGGPLTPGPMRPEWDRQYDAFAKAVAEGAATVATIEDGLRALEITTACEASARTGAVIHRTRDAELARK